jgi:hypothetical protein
MTADIVVSLYVTSYCTTNRWNCLIHDSSALTGHTYRWKDPMESIYVRLAI